MILVLDERYDWDWIRQESEDYNMGEEQNNEGLNQGKTGASGKKGMTSVLKGGAVSSTYNTAYNYEQIDKSKTESKVGNVLMILLIILFVVVAVVAALSYFKVI